MKVFRPNMYLVQGHDITWKELLTYAINVARKFMVPISFISLSINNIFFCIKSNGYNDFFLICLQT